MATNVVLRNIVQKYSRLGLDDLIHDFETGVSGQVTADRMGVSRERVRQWRSLLGTTITLYQPHPDVERARKKPPKGSSG